MTAKTSGPGCANAEGPHGPVAREGTPRGYGAMRDVPLDLDPRIDLTKPIYEQVAALRTTTPRHPKKAR